MQHDIYLDANATTPVLPAAAHAAMRAMQSTYGNPSSSHMMGLQAQALMEEVRTRASRLLDTGEGRLVFVSGATEAIQTAVFSALLAIRAQRQSGKATGGLLVYGATEHKAVPECIAHWNSVLELGLEMRCLPVDGDGRHDLSALAAMAADAALVCTMAANNETGALSDLVGIERVLTRRAPDALWLVDCVQALGKMPLHLCRRRIDYAAFSGHKLYAPKGIGLLYVAARAPFTPLMVGGGQESALRSGTENMAGIAALGAVLRALEDGRTFQEPAALLRMRDALANSLRDAFPGVMFNTPLDHALPTTLNFSVPGRSSKELMDVLDAGGIRVSAGSACSAAKAAPSHVLLAMGLPEERAASAIRMSFGPASDEAWIARACARIRHCGEALLQAQRHPAQAAAADGAALETATRDMQGDAPEIGPQLEVHDMRQFLAQHPDAELVDVREVGERLAGGGLQLCGRATQHAALSALEQHCGPWLSRKDAPLVFVCRSGARSARAAALLRRLGHPNAWHLPGGLALQEPQVE
jgi:cysteine sulfinate desulfinase/cysteine desulfurase-like protein/rhodanese-related sulfurtransferase